LARILHEKTAGNPFFAIQFLSALRDEHLLTFDAHKGAWRWDVGQIEARQFTDNVVDLMIDKLKRLQRTTQEALEQLACLGSSSEIATLSVVEGKTIAEIERALWESIQFGLVNSAGGILTFIHDRVQEAAYSLIPDENRAAVHLRIGRNLLKGLAPAEIDEKIFDVVNQLNGGMSLVTDWDEKLEIAELSLRAARRAKASTAYASACIYASRAMSLLGSGAWAGHYELAFGAWIERAECEFLSGHFTTAEDLIEELLRRAKSKVDIAAVYKVKIDLHVVKSENALAIASGLECLRLFGIDISPHPTSTEVQAEYENVSRHLGERRISDLIDLPLASDPEMQAVMGILSVLYAPAIFTDVNLTCLYLSKMVDLTLDYGTTEAAAVGYVWFGVLLGPVFHRYREGYEFCKLACDLVERHAFTAYRAKTYFAMEIGALWTQPVSAALRHLDTTFRAAIETGDLSVACYSRNHVITDMLLRGDPLAAVWQETERALEFDRKSGFRDVIDVIISQQRFIANMRGLSNDFSSFSGVAFDEAAFEAALTEGRMSTMVCWYWILKMQARFISGDYEAAYAASLNAKQLLWASVGHIQLIDYYYYSALTAAALLNEKASPMRRTALRELLTAHVEQLREWAENGSPTFADKYALVAAEAARVDGRNLQAMQFYDDAVRLAHENHFPQNEGIAGELAGRFCLGLGLESNGYAHLRLARTSFAFWGADGKVRQLDENFPRLAASELHSAPKAVGPSGQQLDLASVVKASQAISGEILLPRLIERLMTIALQSAGADRGLLMLRQGDEFRTAADARYSSGETVVRLREPLGSLTGPESLLRYVIRTRESMILDDATKPNLFSDDPYLRAQSPRAVLCVPLLRQGELGGLLYLENALTSHVFTRDRIDLLELIASQAAISLENTRLYADLQEREAKVRRLVDSNIVGIFFWDLEGRIIEANEAFLRMLGRSRDEVISGFVRWTDLTPEEWRDQDGRFVSEVRTTGRVQTYEKEFLHKDGRRVPVLLGAAAFGGHEDQGVAFVIDVTDRKRAEDEARENERRYAETQLELAHANRVATLGQLSASIAHEVNQPIASAVTNAQAALRWLRHQPPNINEVQLALERIANNANLASAVIGRIHAMVRKTPERMEGLEINEAIRDVIMLIQGETAKNGVVVETELTDDLPLITGDRVQLQQVILNLVINGSEAMSGVDGGLRRVLIRTAKNGPDAVLVAVCDTGPGLDWADSDHVFEAFYTTKPNGLGMGLSICRSIIEAHGGRLWASANVPRGAVFQFTLSSHKDDL